MRSKHPSITELTGTSDADDGRGRRVAGYAVVDHPATIDRAAAVGSAGLTRGGR